MKSSKEIVIVKQELLIGLTEEQIAKVKACKNQEEILKLAKEEGIELTDEQLEAVSGGCGGSEGLTCPFWAKANIVANPAEVCVSISAKNAISHFMRIATLAEYLSLFINILHRLTREERSNNLI